MSNWSKTLFGFLGLAGLALVLLLRLALAQEPQPAKDLDARVKAFLESKSGRWHDMNVPGRDGQFLYRFILEHRFRRVLEIGTSTGHSAIWMAWASSKTGGRLVTIDNDEDRYRQAVENFKKAGLDGFIEAHLADAHELVPTLPGPWDMVFCDADKEWQKNYFIAASPRLRVGGCFVGHNALMWDSGIREFLEYVKSLPGFETTIERQESSGISLTWKR